MKKFCQDLKRQAKLIIDFEEKDKIELTSEEEYKHYIAMECYKCKKLFNKNADDDNDYKEKKL